MDTQDFEVGQSGTLTLLNGSTIICTYISSVPGWLTFTSADGIFTVHMGNVISFSVRNAN